MYYLNINSSDVEKNIKKCANNIMDYHEDLIYGKEHNYRDSKYSDFQCITYY